MEIGKILPPMDGGKPDVLVLGDRLEVAAAPAAEVVDATGAGDVLAGTAAARLALGDELLDALPCGAAAAGRSLGGAGGTGWLPAAA